MNVVILAVRTHILVRKARGLTSALVCSFHIMDEAEAAPQKATPYPAQEQSTPVAFGKQPAAQDGADANGMEPEPSVATEQPATAAAAAAIKKAVKKRSLQDIQSSAAGEDPGERNGEQQAKKTAFTANRVSQGGLTPRGGKKPTTPKEFIEKIRGYIHEKFDVDYDFSEWTCEVCVPLLVAATLNKLFE